MGPNMGLPKPCRQCSETVRHICPVSPGFSVLSPLLASCSVSSISTEVPPCTTQCQPRGHHGVTLQTHGVGTPAPQDSQEGARGQGPGHSWVHTDFFLGVTSVSGCFCPFSHTSGDVVAHHSLSHPHRPATGLWVAPGAFSKAKEWTCAAASLSQAKAWGCPLPLLLGPRTSSSPGSSWSQSVREVIHQQEKAN